MAWEQSVINGECRIERWDTNVIGHVRIERVTEGSRRIPETNWELLCQGIGLPKRDLRTREVKIAKFRALLILQGHLTEKLEELGKMVNEATTQLTEGAPTPVLPERPRASLTPVETVPQCVWVSDKGGNKGYQCSHDAKYRHKKKWLCSRHYKLATDEPARFDGQKAVPRAKLG